MKGKNDDLLRLAFGELSDDAARVVEARADAADRAEIEAFRQLREGLQHLPPPPPDGLSPERLRAAILDRELGAQRRKAPAWGSFLLAPAALAAIAAVVVLPRLRPASEPMVAINEAPLTIESPRFDFGLDTADVAASSMAAPIESPKPVAPALTKAPARETRNQARSYVARRSRRPAQRQETVADEIVPESKPRFALAASSLELDHDEKKLAMMEPPTMAAPPSAVIEGSAKGRPSETVVIVSNQRDLETGALAATEKEVSSVLVGG